MGRELSAPEKTAVERRLRGIEKELEKEVARRRDLEEELARQQGQLQLLLESTKVIPWEADATTYDFIDVGPMAERLLGFPLARWYEKGFWANRIHPEDRELATNICQQFSQTGDEYEFEYRMLTATDQVIWIHDVVSVVRVEGIPSRLRGFMIDVTGRKQREAAVAQSEHQLRLIANSLPVLISYVDAERRYQFNNVAYEKWFGLAHDQIKGRTIWEIHGKDAYDAVRGHVDRALSGLEVSYETDIATQDGSSRRVQAIYVPNIEPAGQVVGFFALVREVGPAS